MPAAPAPAPAAAATKTRRAKAGKRSRLVFNTARRAPDDVGTGSASAPRSTAQSAPARAGSPAGSTRPAPPSTPGGSFRRFDVQQWLRAREARLERGREEQQRSTTPPRSPRGAAPSRGAGYRRGHVSDSTDTLASSLNAIGEKLHALSGRIGVGAPETGRAERPDAALRDRDELIVALHEVVKTQGQQLIVKEEELSDLCGLLSDYKEEEETIFALADAVEQAEQELAAAKEQCEALRRQASESEAQARQSQSRAVSLEWQLRIAVPDEPMRQLIETQLEQARLDGVAMLGLSEQADPAAELEPSVARKSAKAEAEQRRLFLAAARELARLHTEMESVRSQEDALGLWGQRVDAIWSSVQSLSSEVECRRRVVNAQQQEQHDREDLLRTHVARSQQGGGRGTSTDGGGVGGSATPAAAADIEEQPTEPAGAEAASTAAPQHRTTDVVQMLRLAKPVRPVPQSPRSPVRAAPQLTAAEPELASLLASVNSSLQMAQEARARSTPHGGPPDGG